MSTRPVAGPGIHHVAVRAVDFERSLAFYTSGLGFTRAYGWGEGDGRAALLDAGDGNYLELFGGGKPRSTIDSPILHIAFRVPSADTAFKQAIAAGAVEDMAPKDVNLQGDPVVKVRIAFVKGPDGEVIEFFQNDVL